MTRRVNINISIDRILLYRLTEWAEKRGLNRSRAIDSILRAYFFGGEIFC